MFSVDPTWLQAFEENSSFWLNFSLPQGQTHYCSALASSDIFPAQCSSLEAAHLKVDCRKEKNTLHASVSKTDGTHLLSHQAIGQSLHLKLAATKTCMWAFDATEGLFIAGFSNGLLKVFDGGDTTVLRDLVGHQLDVVVAKFFPSGKVALSGGTDFALKIWDLTEGNCAAQLKGHTRGVTSCDFVDRGRNVVSSAKDGYSILWDIPTQTSIHKWGGQSTVNHCSIFAHNSASTAAAQDEKDAGTEGKVLLTASDNGVAGYDLRSRNECFSVGFKQPQNTVIGLNQSHYFVSGGNSGGARCWDLRKPGEVLRELDLGEGTNVLSLLDGNDGRTCWLGGSSGLVLGWDVTKDTFPERSLIGDSEPIYNLVRRAPGSSEILTAARPAVVRAFNV